MMVLKVYPLVGIQYVSLDVVAVPPVAAKCPSTKTFVVFAGTENSKYSDDPAFTVKAVLVIVRLRGCGTYGCATDCRGTDDTTRVCGELATEITFEMPTAIISPNACARRGYAHCAVQNGSSMAESSCGSEGRSPEPSETNRTASIDVPPSKSRQSFLSVRR
jgi:hypothetical protein